MSRLSPFAGRVAVCGVVLAAGLVPLAARSASAGGAVVAIAARPQGDGFWTATSDGGVLPSGAAPNLGSMAGRALAAPIVGLASTVDGNGYWLLGRDGGIFSFGDAAFYGSTGGLRLNQPIAGMAAAPTGRGYWLVARDGGIFAFGNAPFYGSTGSLQLGAPVVGMTATSDGSGYWFVASDGGIFAYGDAPFAGSAAGAATSGPIVGMAAHPGGGYWLAEASGADFPYGVSPVPGGATQTSCGYVPPTPAYNTSYGFERDPNNGATMRWDPRTTIHYVIDPNGAPTDVEGVVQSAVGTAAQVSGLQFAYDGTYDSAADPGPAGSPLRFRWANLGAGTEGGRADYSWVYTPGGNNELIAAVVNVNTASSLAPDYSNGASEGTLVLHELGHALGLGHASDSSQIMNAVLSPSGPTGYGPGDRDGLWHQGPAAGCLN